MKKTLMNMEELIHTLNEGWAEYFNLLEEIDEAKENGSLNYLLQMQAAENQVTDARLEAYRNLTIGSVTGTRSIHTLK